MRTSELETMRVRLSILWIFAILNYLYCDVIGLMNPDYLKGFLAGNVSGMPVTQGFLLGAGILMEIPISMVLLSRLLAYRPNRWTNVIAGTIMTAVQIGSLFMGSEPTPYYIFFSALEIACTAAIVWIAWTWPDPQHSLNHKALEQKGIENA